MSGGLDSTEKRVLQTLVDTSAELRVQFGARSTFL